MSEERKSVDGISGSNLKTIGQIIAIGALVAGGAAQASAIRSDLNNLMSTYRQDMSLLQRRLDKTEDLQSRLNVLESNVNRDREDGRTSSIAVDRRLGDIADQIRRLNEEVQRSRRR